MLEGSEEIEGVNPTEQTNSDSLADYYSTTNPTNVNGLTGTEGEANGVWLSDEVPEERIFDDVKQNINTVYVVLKEDLELLASKRDKFMLMSQKINDVHFSEVIKLNVGGHIFQTSLQNMRKYPESTLAAMFSENFDLVKGDDGAYFIDRDGTHFRHILNFIRSGDSPPENILETAEEELIREAEFFGLGRLAEIIKEPNTEITEGGENQSKAKECQSPDRNDLESKINEHCQQTKAIIDEIKLKLEKGHSALQKSFGNLQEQKMEYFEMKKKVETVHFPKNHKSHQKQLLEWLHKEDQPNSMQLIYSAELDGWDAEDFHKNCDGISPTLVLMESTHGNIFGGYTTKPWSSNYEHLRDKELFVFQLAVKQTEETFKTNWKDPAIRCMLSCGPMFGFIGSKVHVKVLTISGKPNINWSICTGLQDFTTNDGLKVTNKRLAGSERFRLTRMEVFEVIERGINLNEAAK